jgi:hypothetical protein
MLVDCEGWKVVTLALTEEIPPMRSDRRRSWDGRKDCKSPMTTMEESSGAEGVLTSGA